MKKNLIKYILLAIGIIAGVLWYLLSREVSPNVDKGSIVFELGGGEVTDNTKFSVGSKQESVTAGDIQESTEQTASSEPTLISVHVCGAVVNPGVYEIAEGLRVVHAIEAAGGTSEYAFADYLNLADVVKDGARIYVPTAYEVEAGLADSLMSGDEVNDKLTEAKQAKVNINTATKEELILIPGIGESKAESIIEYRENVGKFKTIEDIMMISGIKEAIFNRIKDYITV